MVERAVPAVSRALDILELFIETGDLTVPEVTARLGLPRTSVHEIVGTLAARSYLEPVPGQANRYRLGVAPFHLGSAYAARLDLAREGQVEAGRVAGECGETVQVAVPDGREVVYVAKVDSTQSVRLVSSVGARLPAHCTAVGLMLLSALSAEEFEELFPAGSDLPGLTPRSLTSVSALRKRLAGIRARGLASEYCESNDAVACVAAPVRDHEGAVRAAMSISVPTIRWSDARAEELGEIVSAGAAALSNRLGYRPA